MMESQIYPCFVIDKKGKILYTNKDGARIISNRYDARYKGKPINSFYDLVHHSSKKEFQAIIGGGADQTLRGSERKIAILQQFTSEDESKEIPLDIGLLIAMNKLNYFKARAYNGNWNTGNCIILTCENTMGELIKDKLISGKSSCILSYIDELVSKFEKMYNANLEDEEVSKTEWISTLSNAYQLLENFQTINSILKSSIGSYENKKEWFDIIKTTK